MYRLYIATVVTVHDTDLPTSNTQRLPTTGINLGFSWLNLTLSAH